MPKINVKNANINILSINNEDYLCLTDMLDEKDGHFFISDWLRNRNTLEFLGIWESIHNKNFNYGEFALIRNKAGLNSYKISVKEWSRRTNAIGLYAKAGRYGGTYAHKDLAFEFGMWISPEFKIYLIKEFQRLKDKEQEQAGWNMKRNISKINYFLQTETIKEKLIPKKLTQDEINYIYASEADILNKALFGMTAKEWCVKNSAKKGNIRDEANVLQLICLSNLESLNAHLILEEEPTSRRIKQLNTAAIYQMKILAKIKNKKEILK